MRKILTFFAIFVVFFCGAGVAFSAEYAEGEVLVVLEVPQLAMSVAASDMSAFASSLSMQADSFANSVEAKTVDTYPEIARSVGKNIIHLRSDSKTTEQLMNELKNDPRVKSVSPNYIMKLNSVPNDEHYSKQWAPQMIGAPEVWDKTTGSTDIVVAVIDSGIDYRHPDLSANMVRDTAGYPGRRFYSEYVYSEELKKIVSSEPRMDVDPHPIKAGTGGHGTHVAGIIGAVGNNKTGVAGVNWRVGLLAVNVSTYIKEMKISASLANDEIAGIDYILSEKRSGMNIRVVNMSIGQWKEPEPGNSPYALAIKAMSDAGIIVAISAGNNLQDLNSPGMGKLPTDKHVDYSKMLMYPACYKFDLTITVGAVGSADEKAIYSNWGDKWVDITAPGGNMMQKIDDPRVLENGILSTIPTELPSSADITGYDFLQGTSMSAPYVAGAAALLMAAYPNETSAQIKARILNGAKKIGISEGYWKHGRLDIAGAYNYISASKNSSSSSGCTAAPGVVFVLLFAVPVVVKWKKK